MNTKFVALLAAALFASGPALAQPAAPAPAPKPTVSVESLLQGGYEVKVITDVSADEQKSIWPSDAVNPYIMVTLQKGGSLAVFAMSMVSWVNQSDSTLANASLCKKN
jgi:hypothetical protein